MSSQSCMSTTRFIPSAIMLSLSYMSTSQEQSFPRKVTFEQVSSSQRQLFSLAHLRISKCPPLAAYEQVNSS